MDNNPLHHNKNPHSFLPNPLSTERVPQWTHAETKELLAARSELDTSFAESKRNKALWEAVATRLQQKGVVRTPEQCKSKWKNLVTRFKGSEAMEGSSDRFPFQDEMRSIFAERTERLLRSDKGKGPAVAAEVDDKEEEEKPKSKGKKKKAVAATKEGGAAAALREFASRQMEMQVRRMEAAQEREAERRAKEEEWRREMEALAEERAAAERRWMERQEERRAREEARDERRHAVIAAIVSRLSNRGE